MYKAISHSKMPYSRRKCGTKLTEDHDSQQDENLSFAMYSYIEEEDKTPKEQKTHICNQKVNNLQQPFVKTPKTPINKTPRTSKNSQQTRQQSQNLKQTKSQTNWLRFKCTVSQQNRKNTTNHSNKENQLNFNNVNKCKTPTVRSHKKMNDRDGESVTDLEKIGKSGTKQKVEKLSNNLETGQKLSRNNSKANSSQSMATSIKGNDKDKKYQKHNQTKMMNMNKKSSQKNTDKDHQNKDITHSQDVKKGSIGKSSKKQINTDKRPPVLNKKKEEKQHRSISEKILPLSSKMHKSSTLSRHPQTPNYFTGTKIKDKIKKLGMDRNAVSIIIQKQTSPKHLSSQKKKFEREQINQEQLFDYLFYGDLYQTKPQVKTDQSEISEESEEILLEGYHGNVHSSVNELYHNQDNNSILHHSLQPYHLNNNAINEDTMGKNKIDISPIMQISHCKSLDSELSYSQLFHRNKSNKNINKIDFQSQYLTNLPVGTLKVSHTSSGYFLRLDQQYIRKLLLTEHCTSSNQKMLNYIRVQDSVLYQRLFSNFKETPSNIYNLYMLMRECGDIEKLTHKLRQYLFCQNVVFNKSELHDFINCILQMSQCMGLKLDNGIDSGILLEILFVTNSINNKNHLDNKQRPIYFDQTQIKELVTNNNNRQVSIWSIVQEIHENIKNQLNQQTNKPQNKQCLSVTEMSLYSSSFLQQDHSSYRPYIQNHTKLLKVITQWLHQFITTIQQ